MRVLGFDIGGTKCAVITAEVNGEDIRLIKRESCPTDTSVTPSAMIEKLISMADGMLDLLPERIGISCGGPLDSKRGVILSPPNLPGWDNVEIVKQLKQHYNVNVNLQNDANACAVAEWKFGAGRGMDNVVFLTFGTGLGAGLILNGRLYEGRNGNAGEVGHIRLEDNGPIGFGKAGSFEGFCSGGGIARLGYKMAIEAKAKGESPLYFRENLSESDITARAIAEAAAKGDKTALEVFRISGEHLGRGLAILIDVLNPDAIIIGSIYARQKELLYKPMKKELLREALSVSAECCKILPAELGEQIGDYAAIAAALL